MVKRTPTNRLADGSGSVEQQLHASAVRVIDAYQALQRRANAICEDLDDITPVHGIPTTELSDEDSMVIVVRDAIVDVKR